MRKSLGILPSVLIQFKAKTKISQKPKKKAHKVSSRASRTSPKLDGGLTPEDIAGTNMFSAAIAKMNGKTEAKTVAEWKKFQGAKRQA